LPGMQKATEAAQAETTAVESKMPSASLSVTDEKTDKLEAPLAPSSDSKTEKAQVVSPEQK
jgi:hypothetical protein